MLIITSHQEEGDSSKKIVVKKYLSIDSLKKRTFVDSYPFVSFRGLLPYFVVG